MYYSHCISRQYMPHAYIANTALLLRHTTRFMEMDNCVILYLASKMYLVEKSYIYSKSKAKTISDLLNCINNNSREPCEYNCDTSYGECIVTGEEVTNAIRKLDVNKAGGSADMFSIYRQGTCSLTS